MIACVVRSRRWAARQWIEPCILSSRDHQGATDAIEWKDDGREEGSQPGYTQDWLRYQSRIRAVSTLLQSLLSEVHTRDLEQERQQDMIDSEALLGHQEYPVLSPIHLLWSNPLTLCVGSNRVKCVAETQSFTTTFLRVKNFWTHVSKTRRSTLSTARSKTHVNNSLWT